MKPKQIIARSRRREARAHFKCIQLAKSIRSHDELQLVLLKVPEDRRREVFETIKPYLRGREEWGPRPVEIPA